MDVTPVKLNVDEIGAETTEGDNSEGCAPPLAEFGREDLDRLVTDWDCEKGDRAGTPVLVPLFS